MHAEGIVARIVGPCVSGIHSKRSAALTRATVALLRGGVASLSAIALHLGQATALKHRIKSVDRLLGNPALQQVRVELYRRLARAWLADLTQWLIVVDWSDVTVDRRWQLLRASVVVEGRSVTLYEEVHPRKKYGAPGVHRAFVERLGRIVPGGCRVVVMTDAGFHAPWFKLIEARGWHFLGRIRGKNRLRLGETGPWMAARDWYRRAGSEACDLGPGYYVQSNPVGVRAVLARRPRKGRHRLNLQGRKSKAHPSRRCARSAREPWLLVSSLPLRHLSAATLIGLYAQRMQIEQSFRDTKNLRTGLGLEAARSRSGARFEMLLLLVHLASFVQRLIGESVKNHQMELQFMASRRRARREVSVLTLGRRILAVAPNCLDRLHPWQAIPMLRTQARPSFVVAG